MHISPKNPSFGIVVSLLALAYGIGFSPAIHASETDVLKITQPSAIDQTPLHPDGGLIYNPLSAEARKTGQLTNYENVEFQEVTIRESGIEASFRLPKTAKAYDVIPIHYTVRNDMAKPQPGFHLAATAFESRQEDGDGYADLSLPYEIDLEIEYLGSVTADLIPDARHILAKDLGDEPAERYPNFKAQPLQKSGEVQAGDIVWFQFRIINTGNTILDPEGIGAFFFSPRLERLDDTGQWQPFGIPYNRYIRIKEYIYPGESTDLWFHFMSDDSETPQGFGLIPGKYRIVLDGVARFEREYNWLVNLWAGRTVSLNTWTFEVTKEPNQTEPAPVEEVVGNYSGSNGHNQWLHGFEEFMTSFERIHPALDAHSERSGTFYLQVAPWTEEIVLKLALPDEAAPATATVPIQINEETLEVDFHPQPRNLVWSGEKWKPLVMTQAMFDMRANLQLGPNVARNIREEVARMQKAGITATTTTAMPWLYDFVQQPYIHSQPTEISNQNGDALKYFLDVARETGMKVEGWGNYPYSRRTIGEIASWLTDEDYTLAAAFPMEASHADPLLPTANAVVWKYHFDRWGDLFYVNAAGERPFSAEDTRGWLRMDIHIRYPTGPKVVIRFQEWLREKYGDLDSLNQAWDTGFGSWNQINPEAGQSANTWNHIWVYDDDDNPFHDWSPAVVDWDRFRTELRLENYADTLDALTPDIPGAVINLRTEGSNVLVSGIDSDDPDPHKRHVVFNQYRNAMIPEMVQEPGTVAYHSDYTTLPYSPSTVRALTRDAVDQGITPAWLPQFDHMRDVVINERYGTEDYTRALNTDEPVKAAMVHVLTAVYPWWKATVEEGGVPGILWADYECDGFVTETQEKEMQLFKKHLEQSLKNPDTAAYLENLGSPEYTLPKNPKNSYQPSHSRESDD